MGDSDFTDVFVRIYANDLDRSLKWKMRRGLIDATVARWKMFEGIRLTTIVAGADIPEKNFHIVSKSCAERYAATSIYIVADDDCLPIGVDFVERGLALMEAWPKFGLISATSICDGHYPAGAGAALTDVVEEWSAGGVAFVRRGILTKFPPCTPDQVDETICNEIRRYGYKTGVMPEVSFNHLGAHYSVTSRDGGNWSA